ncbi:MAG: hypothetical protein V4615_09215, partial [Bacteroidota bacterium]
TTIKYTAYYGKMSSQATQVAIREGLTIAKNNSRTAAEHKVTSLEGLVKFKFGLESPTYQEFYPQGLTEYQNCSDAALEIKLDRIVGAAGTHLTADFPDEVTAIADLRTAFKTAHLAQNNAFSNIDNVITGKHVDRKALTVQLTKNFLLVAADNIDNTDKYDDFFNPQLLPIRTGIGSQPAGTALLEGNVPSPGFINIDISDIAGTPLSTIVILVTLSGLRFYSSATADGVPTPTTLFVDLEPGQSLNKKIDEFVAQLGLGGSTPYLMVQNIGMVLGHYKITFDKLEEE